MLVGGWWSGLPLMKYNERFMPDVVAQIPKSANLIVGCQKGLRSLAACEQLYKAGYRNLYWLNGGFDAVQEGVLICVCLVDTYPLLMCAYYSSTVSCCKLQKFCDCSGVIYFANFKQSDHPPQISAAIEYQSSKL
jgi:hypothetical protein